MTDANDRVFLSDSIPVIDLLAAPGREEAWNRPRWVVYLWSAAELIFVANPWQISSKLRARVLRTFGATIGSDVIIRPRTRVKFPWKLAIGDRSWIGEGVWIHNQDQVTIGHDAVISQDTFITTGSHAHRRDMGLITRPVIVEDGAWVTSRCVITGGVTIGRSALIEPLTHVVADVTPNTIIGPASPKVKGMRFKTSTDDRAD